MLLHPGLRVGAPMPLLIDLQSFTPTTAAARRESSNAVAALISLLAPVPYAPDFRPYFTIHDEDFTTLCKNTTPAGTPGGAASRPGSAAGAGPACCRDGPVLIGVTNLFFIRSLPHWQHVLAVGVPEARQA